MAGKLHKLQKHIQRVFGDILQREADVPADAFITISQVEVSSNLHSATIWLYISPLERSEAVLTALKTQMYDLQGSFNRALHMHPLPRLILKIDTGAAYADKIEQQFKRLHDNEASDTGAPASSS